MMQLNRALVDADSIYFRTACVTKNKKDIRKSIDYTMQEIERATMAGEIYTAVKGRGNFRKDIYPDYKATRKPLDEDLKKALTYGHEYMVDKYNAIMADNMEADDLVSIWARECRDDDISYVIVGIDKDLLQIPGDHYNFVKKTHQFINYEEGHLKLMLQCLTGDTADNIPGIKGVGPKKAEKILAGIPTSRQWDRVRAAWRGHRAGDPFLSRALLTMLTSFEEEDIVRDLFKGKAAECKQDVLAGKESKD